MNWEREGWLFDFSEGEFSGHEFHEWARMNWEREGGGLFDFGYGGSGSAAGGKEKPPSGPVAGRGNLNKTT
jgi:hypothetical protein